MIYESNTLLVKTDKSLQDILERWRKEQKDCTQVKMEKKVLMAEILNTDGTKAWQKVDMAMNETCSKRLHFSIVCYNLLLRRVLQIVCFLQK